MAAKRYKLRLYRGLSVKGAEVEVNLDPKNGERLRELLEERVKAVTGTLQVDLSAGWRLHVLGLHGGPIHAKVSVDSAGRTVIR